MTDRLKKNEHALHKSPATKRSCCTHCLRPINACLCPHIHLINNHIEVIILQHPLEVKEAKNTACLLHLCLNNSQLHVGEKFDDTFFAQLKLSSPALKNSATYDLLLYPETPEEKSMGILTPPIIAAERILLGNPLNKKKSIRLWVPIRLWVIDATWRKSRKMLYLNHALQTLPRLKLNQSAPTLYSIRKAHNENQLSTLEASCYALQQLEHNLIDYTPVLTAFANFIAQHKAFIPSLPS